MPIAAVPNYLKRTAEGGLDEQFFLSSPPGHRFGLYFPVWGWDGELRRPNWSLEDRVKRLDKGRNFAGWKEEANKSFAAHLAAGCAPLKNPSIECHWQPEQRLSSYALWAQLSEGIRARQIALAATLKAGYLYLQATAVSPFTTGLGNEHPLENGFAFLNPYGLPYLPGSGVKGVLRRAAQELAGGEWGDARGWSKDEHYQVTIDGKAVRLSMIDVLFGREPPPGDSDAVRGALTFWDVIPEIKGDSLMVEVMTPHQSHYYQRRREPKSGNSDSPHDSGQPNPIFFLTVPPGSKFAFHVLCDEEHLNRLNAPCAPGAVDLCEDVNGEPRWKRLLRTAFEHAFAWLGFGAKTAVGYGAMTIDAEAEKEARQRAEQAKREAERAAMTPGRRAIEAFREEITRFGEQTRWKKTPVSQSTFSKLRDFAQRAAQASDWTPEERKLAADVIEEFGQRLIALEVRELRRKLGLAALRGQG